MVLAIAPSANAQVTKRDLSCASGFGCFWTGTDYIGNKVTVGAGQAGTGWHNFDNEKRSFKNAFSNKGLHIATESNGGGGTTCLTPIQNIPCWFPIYGCVSIKSYKVTNNGC